MQLKQHTTYRLVNEHRLILNETQPAGGSADFVTYKD